MADEKLCPELTAEEVAELIAQCKATIVDVNPRRRWSSGHLPGALNLDPAAFTEGDLPPDKSTMLVFYCNESGGTASRFAAQKAAKMGYAHVFTMPDGLRGWMAAGKRVMAGR